MKKFLIILAFSIMLFTSCNEGKNRLEYNTLIVLKGYETNDNDGSKYYQLYIFDGDESYWVNVDKKIMIQYN